NTDNAMLSTLRGGLSLGVSGFSFWSHDIGGFVLKSPEELYRRWLPFGMLTSHTRTHGTPPKEPWLISESFTNAFRQSTEMKYKLMPYIYAQAKECSEKGLPMMRALFVEFPEDPGAWMIEDEYMFGSDMLVAPLFKEGSTGRQIYLPKGNWVDYQTGKEYGNGWHEVAAGEIPAIIMVRSGSMIPHIALAQSTDRMDWSKLELLVYGKKASEAKGLVCLPSDNKLTEVTLTKKGSGFQVSRGKINGVSYQVSLKK
ncbi:MAG: glycoside hydrolase family 31 protein, partial [Bacteroidales bacterium]|nr:glycoside hydrolase family 31 protein [Bacteroidales bacterium]